jgi:tRNA dimethylallyltransferase
MRPVLIAGPTASGKSALALRLAERDRGVVINADASQVYGCWRVLTARPDDADLARAPHRLYGHVDCAERYSVGAWLRVATATLEAARRDELRPIIVGGTGLYFAALTQGLAEIPEVPQEVHARSSACLAAGGLGSMLEALRRDDPETYARIDRDNPRRVQRAWDVLVGTGTGLAAWQAATPRPLLPADAAVRLVVAPETSRLNVMIEHRFDAMVKHGALDECRRYLALGLDPELPSAWVLGAPPLFALLRGTIDLAEARAAAITATRRYAKRQRTWMRNRMADWTRIDPADDALASVPPE